MKEHCSWRVTFTLIKPVCSESHPLVRYDWPNFAKHLAPAGAPQFVPASFRPDLSSSRSSSSRLRSSQSSRDEKIRDQPTGPGRTEVGPAPAASNTANRMTAELRRLAFVWL